MSLKKFEDLDEKELDELALHGTDRWRQAVAKHPNSSLQTLLYLAASGLVEEVDQNPMLLLHIEVGSKLVVQILEHVARQTERAERLAELSSSERYAVRYQVARNKSTPSAILERLAKDERWSVRFAVYNNKSTPSETLELLSKEMGKLHP